MIGRTRRNGRQNNAGWSSGDCFLSYNSFQLSPNSLPFSWLIKLTNWLINWNYGRFLLNFHSHKLINHWIDSRIQIITIDTNSWSNNNLPDSLESIQIWQFSHFWIYIYYIYNICTQFHFPILSHLCLIFQNRFLNIAGMISIQNYYMKALSDWLWLIHSKTERIDFDPIGWNSMKSWHVA